MIISGKIIDVNNEPLSGANIYPVKNGEFFNQGGISDFDGNFNIELSGVNNDTQVLISFIGYKTVSTTVGELKNKTITMPEDIEQLNEVVITYQKEKPTNTAGLIETKKKNNLVNIAIIGTLSALAIILTILIIKNKKDGK